MSDKINSYTCLMLSVYKCFPQMVKYGLHRNDILQDLTGIKLKFLWRPVKPKASWKPVFNNRKPVCQKEMVLTSLIHVGVCVLFLF